MLHNESVNVWTHLLGVLIFISILVWTAVSLSPIVTYLEPENLFG
jgi:predicted membrane channel-forming protein YqfA (hemolysin III family)